MEQEFAREELVYEKEIENIIQHEYNKADEEEVHRIMKQRTNMDVLWRVYKEYMDMFVISNDEMKKIMFHMMLGAFFTHHGFGYMESGEKKSVRLHTFIIQDSGTGKSHTVKVVIKQLKKMGLYCRTTILDNEAALTGSVYMGQDNEVQIQKGLLHKLDVWTCDEGSLLLKDLPYTKTITDNLQHVMDEPGKVSKGMKLGTVDYPSGTTIVAMSYMFEEFKETIMHKGFLQRMFVLYKKFSKEEEKRIRIGKNLLKLNKDTGKIKKFEEKIVEIMFKINSSMREKIPDGGLYFNAKDTIKFNVYLENLYEQYIDMQFAGEKQTVLKTFFNRVHIIIDKIATQRAIVNGHKEVRYDDMIYAANMAKVHLMSVHKIFENINIKKTLTPMDYNTITVRKIIKDNKNTMVLDDLMKKLYDLHSIGRWDSTYKRTAKFIDEMVKSGVITKNVTKDGKVVIML